MTNPDDLNGQNPDAQQGQDNPDPQNEPNDWGEDWGDVDYKALYEQEKKAREEAEQQKDKRAGRFKKGRKKIDDDYVSKDDVEELVSEKLSAERFRSELGEDFEKVQKISEEKGVPLEIARDLHELSLYKDEQYQAQQRAGAYGIHWRQNPTPPTGKDPQVDATFKARQAELKAKYGIKE